MKKLLTTLLISFSLFGCQNQTKISEKLTDNLIYRFEAKYPNSKTKEVQKILSEHLKDSGMSFVNKGLNADMKLGNGMSFYIKSEPSILKIVFDKSKNSEEDYLKMKDMCQEIRDIFS